MKNLIEKSLGVGVVAAVGVLAAIGAACSSGSTVVGGAQVNCGAGTTLSGNTCVADQPDGGTTAEDSSAGADTAMMDSAPPVEDADAGDVSDAQVWVSDPCPTSPPTVNCDPTCDLGILGDAGLYCVSFACAFRPSTQPQGANDPSVFTVPVPATLRTPNRPPDAWAADAAYSNCQATCFGEPDGSFEKIDFGLAFRANASTSGDVIEVRVGAPWTIDLVTDDSNPTFCPAVSTTSIRTQGCGVSTTGRAMFVVWTDDPAAVARDIEVTEVPVGTACQ